MTPNAAAAADAAVLFAALVTLVAIVAKLVTANLIQRTKKSWAVLDVRRKDISSRLKEVQLKRTSARGTLEFWERRRSETQQKVFDLRRDFDAYVEQLGPLGADDAEEDLASLEGDTQTVGFFSPAGDADDEDGLLSEPDESAAEAGYGADDAPGGATQVTDLQSEATDDESGEVVTDAADEPTEAER